MSFRGYKGFYLEGRMMVWEWLKGNRTFSSKEILLSIVVIGRNEGTRLSRCLESIKRLSFTPGTVEYIYVDSASIDDSVRRAETVGFEVIKIKPTRPSASIARNAGWRRAHGQFIFFVDGDTVVDPNFTNEALKEFEHPNVGVVFGRVHELHPENSIYNKLIDLDWNPREGQTVVCGGNSIIRRLVLEEVEGFNPILIAGEEPDLCDKIKSLGYLVVYLNRMMVYHDLNITQFSQYWKRGIRTGYAYANIASISRMNKRELYQKESKHNLIKISLLLTALIAAITSSFVFTTLIPIGLYLLLLTFLIAYTTWNNKEKTPKWATRISYAIHAHFLHIPMFVGQIAYFIDNFKGRSRYIIEYK